MGRTVISLIFPILTGAAVLRFPLIACAISFFSIAESAANHNGNLFTSDRAECPESEYPAPGSAEITTHGFCGQICFDNTGGCDTIEETNRCRTGSYYRPLWQKMQSLWGLSAPVSYRKRRTHGNETETGPCERAVTGHPAHPAGMGGPGIWSKRGGQHHTGHSHGQDPVEPQRHGGGAVYLPPGISASGKIPPCGSMSTIAPLRTAPRA